MEQQIEPFRCLSIALIQYQTLYVEQQIILSYLHLQSIANCDYWIGTGFDCSEIIPSGLAEPNSPPTIDSCNFRSFDGPNGVEKWTYVMENKLIVFEGALVELTVYGVGTPLLPFHLQGAVFLFFIFSSHHLALSNPLCEFSQ
jgi:hypothetical protein